jgi:hypothetical protein
MTIESLRANSIVSSCAYFLAGTIRNHRHRTKLLALSVNICTHSAPPASFAPSAPSANIHHRAPSAPSAPSAIISTIGTIGTIGNHGAPLPHHRHHRQNKCVVLKVFKRSRWQVL